ncbi:MAG TPA: hypothetical protein VGN72_00585 [Tepidisphaeraceae bacterium]|jgi:ribosomal protein L29|nr:hypothetical protein [Tepidisphaeraceae bacterium]
MSFVDRAAAKRLAELQRMSLKELEREVVRCRAQEETQGLPNKARRGWKLFRQMAEDEIIRRSVAPDSE